MKYVKMPRKVYVAEHRKLIRILKSGNKRGLRQEYKAQSRELKSYLRGKK
jgi:hypothetical protein